MPKTATKPTIHAATVIGDGKDDDFTVGEIWGSAYGLEVKQAPATNVAATTATKRKISNTTMGFFIFPPILRAGFVDKSFVLNVS